MLSAHLATRRLSFLYAALFFEVGIALPFLPVWLDAQSLDASQIGIVLPAPLLARIVANPLVGADADRHGAIGSVLAWAAAAVVVFTVLLGLASGFVAILSWTAAAWAASMAGLTTLCGSLYAALGEHAYWLMTATATAGIGLFLRRA